MPAIFSPCFRLSSAKCFLLGHDIAFFLR